MPLQRFATNASIGRRIRRSKPIAANAGASAKPTQIASSRAGVAKNLTPIGVVPTSESQVRVLSTLAPTDQVKVYRNALKAAEGDPNRVTAKAISDAVTKLGLKAVQPAASTSSAGNVSGGTPRSTQTPRDDGKLVNRDEVFEAIADWAEQNWETVSQLSVADFTTAIKGVIAKI